MILWEMSSDEGMLVGYVPDKSLSKALTLCGINPVAVRKALVAAHARPANMQVVKPSADKVEREPQNIPNIVFWAWIPIFSDTAASAAIELGCESDEFWPCRFQSNPKEKYHIHLPTKTFDIVDVEKSTFRHVLPLNPPVPMYFERLVTRTTLEDVPPCFRANIPGTNQTFPRLLVREDFKLIWEKDRFSGAVFRQLTK